MKRKFKNAIVFMLIICMTAFTIGTLTSCGGEDYDPDNFLINGTDENPYQIVKEEITLDIFVPRSSSNPSYSSMVMFQELSEMTNINFNFEEADTSAYSSIRSAKWEDKNNLPDLFLFSNTISEQSIYSQYDAIVPFNDESLVVEGVEVGSLVDNYMPTYKALLENNFGIEDEAQNAIDVATFPDGNMYSTLSVGDVPRDLTYKMFINEQWIKNLQEDSLTDSSIRMSDGSSIPDVDDIKTIEQYIEILEMFSKYDVNRNGDLTDEVPLSSASMSYVSNFIMASYGYVNGGIEVENDGSEIIYVPQTDAYKNYLQTSNYLWSNGLMDKSTFSMTTDTQLAEKGLEGRLGTFVAAAAYLTVGLDLEEEYVTLGPLTSEYYKGEPLHWGFSYFEPTATMIPTGTPYVREIARLIDIMYSEVGTQLISYGVEGENWTWDDDEKTTWTFIVPDDWTGSQEDYRATITPNVGTGSKVYWSYDFVGKMNDEILLKLNAMCEKYTPYLKVPIPADLKLDGDSYNEVELIKASLDIYLTTQEYAFITGSKNFDSDYTSFQTSLVGYKANDLTTIYNDAYQAMIA